MRLFLISLLLLVGAAIWISDLRRRLQAARMRGDMYRDISARLDRRLSELMTQ
ncbi:MAG: hypothetical protein HC893_08505 [Chloroflexaceae bacterium]|nr:hypothetical protein [Chloroflexaceae bacterium]NJL33883.1 hypothetical protein [Chloroflexaceae bacterium]NJO05008.1 hypothetical protein [Chloroflexaceae bacterium]